MTANRTILSVLILASAVLLGACTNSAPKAGEKPVGTQQSAVISTAVGKACVGRVEPHQWTFSSLLIATADTTKCGFTTPPYIFTSLGGNQNQAAVLGVNAIRSLSNTGFQAYLKNQTVTTTDVEAKAWGWYLDWEAYSTDFKSPTVCVGKTTAGAGWVQSGSNSIRIDVVTTSCGFTGADPMYFTSLGATNASWPSKGVSSIYKNAPTFLGGFQIQLNETGITPAVASSRGYYITWKGVRPAVETQLKTLSRVCTGKSPLGLWQAGGTNLLFMDVTTGDCGFSHEPAIFTSLGGGGNHYTALGSTSVFSPTDRSFRTYINTTLTATQANDASASAWFVNWARVDSY